MWLSVLPGAVTLAGGLIVLLSGFRPSALAGSWLAALAGAWFAVGHLLAGHWTGIPAAGTPVGGATRSVLEQIGFFTGLGVAIVFVAALALGRFTVVAVTDAVARSTSPVTGAAAEPAAADTVGAGAARSGAAATRSGAAARVRPVPVFRGRSRAADTSDAAETTATGAEAAPTR